jgi:hypothetical protein
MMELEFFLDPIWPVGLAHLSLSCRDIPQRGEAWTRRSPRWLFSPSKIRRAPAVLPMLEVGNAVVAALLSRANSRTHLGSVVNPLRLFRRLAPGLGGPPLRL